MTDALDTITKLQSLKHSERLVYHVGYLARDKGMFGDGPTVALIARAVTDLADQGRIVLTQRKLADMLYEYIATGVT